MTLLNENILKKDEELAVKENKVIAFMLIVVLRRVPSQIIDGQ